MALVDQAANVASHGVVIGRIQEPAARSACRNSAVLAVRKSSWLAEGTSPCHAQAEAGGSLEVAILHHVGSALRRL
jgi:hypothetical protein